MTSRKEFENTFLGEQVVAAADTPFASYSREDWAMHFIEMYGQIDGAHHKAAVLDQVAKILKGAPIQIRLASWSSGTQEYRFDIGTSDDYEAWVEKMLDRDEDGNPQYHYDNGTD